MCQKFCAIFSVASIPNSHTAHVGTTNTVIPLI